ncbi:hypothetical protein [Helicobacter ganmani]
MEKINNSIDDYNQKINEIKSFYGKIVVPRFQESLFLGGAE